jgi:hypothetical protein
MRVKRATFVGLLGASMLFAGMQGAASAAEVADQGMTKPAVVHVSSVEDSAAHSSLKCETGRSRDNGGWARCKGTGTWRVRSECRHEPDKYTSWQRQRGGTVRVSARDCRSKLTGVSVETR